MSEYLIDKSNIEKDFVTLADEVDMIIDAGGQARVKVTSSKGNGKWGMARLWYKWMKQTAEYMAANGSTMPLMISPEGEFYGSRPFNEKDAHELFSSQWLGLNDKGERLSWAKKPGPNVADKGQRWLAMMKHENWCIEKGINLYQPRNSEYNEMKEQQNG